MMSIFSKRKGGGKNRTVAVFDIGSASIGGLLFQQGENRLPQIINTIRQPVDFSKQTTALKAWRSMHKAFVDVAKKLKKDQSQNPDFALCVFSSPWYVSQTRIIKVKRKKSFKVTDGLINKLIQEEARNFKKLWQKGVWEEENTGSFFEQLPIKTLLNGYDIGSPAGKEVLDLELYAYVSLGLDMLETNIKEDILTYIKPNNVYLHSFPYVLFSVLSQIINTQEGVLFVDISGEITDVFIIKNNVIEEINSFPKGENFLVRRLASVLNIAFDEAKTVFFQYSKGELDEAYSKKVGDTLKQGGKEWGNDFKKLLDEIGKDKFLPQALYFCGNAGNTKEINGQVKDESFSALTIFGKPFDVKYLLPESLKYHFDFKKGFSDTNDIFLLISSLYANEFLK